MIKILHNFTNMFLNFDIKKVPQSIIQYIINLKKRGVKNINNKYDYITKVISIYK
jgi:hypothetical protein